MTKFNASWKSLLPFAPSLSCSMPRKVRAERSKSVTLKGSLPSMATPIRRSTSASCSSYFFLSSSSFLLSAVLCSSSASPSLSNLPSPLSTFAFDCGDAVCRAAGGSSSSSQQSFGVASAALALSSSSTTSVGHSNTERLRRAEPLMSSKMEHLLTSTCFSCICDGCPLTNSAIFLVSSLGKSDRSRPSMAALNAGKTSALSSRSLSQAGWRGSTFARQQSKCTSWRFLSRYKA
mmetsp:Transcript_40715/g.75696  ORF Transcript_40715/g.75696 Transcript_40715/m.75696 type:complete len:234 (-) Transcript_40715:3667-4368(-)